MTFESDANSVYVNGQAVDKAGVLGIWAAVDGLVTEVRRGRLWTYAGSSPSGQTPPEGTDTIITTHANSSLQIWEVENNPPAAETETEKLDATGVWWRREFDSRDLSSGIAGNADALAQEIQDRIDALSTLETEVRNGRIWHTTNADFSTQTPPEGTAQISVVTNQGQYVWRVHPEPPVPDPDNYQQSADGLWWRLVTDTEAMVASVSSLQSEFRSGRVWAYAGPSPSGITPPESTDTIITTLQNSSLQIWERENNPPAVETETEVEDATGQWWRREWDSREDSTSLAAETDARIAEDDALRADLNELQEPLGLYRGEKAVIAELDNEPILVAGDDGRLRAVFDDWTVDDLASRLGTGGGGSASPVSPDLLNGIDGWSVWKSGDLLTFQAVFEPFSYSREYVMLPPGDPWVNGLSAVPIHLVYGDGLGLGVTSVEPSRVTQIATLQDGAGQDGLEGAAPGGDATDIARAGAGFAALSADVTLESDTGLARWVGVRSEAVTGATLTELNTGQAWSNFVRARDQFINLMPSYGRTAYLNTVTFMHGAGDDSASYEADLISLMGSIEGMGASQINVFVPCGTTERGDFASTLATIEAFRNRGTIPMRLVAPLYPYPRDGLANPTPAAMTMLAELDSLCASDPDWLPPLAFYAERNSTTIMVDFEVMPGRSLVAPTTGLSFTGAAITSATIIADPITGLMTRLQVDLDAASAGTLTYAYSAAEASGDMRDNWGSPSRAGGTLRNYALPFSFEV